MAARSALTSDLLALGCENGEIRIFSLGDSSPSQLVGADSSKVWSVHYSPDGQRLVSPTAEGGKIKVWDLASKRKILDMSIPRRNATRLLTTSINGVSFKSGTASGSLPC